MTTPNFWDDIDKKNKPPVKKPEAVVDFWGEIDKKVPPVVATKPANFWTEVDASLKPVDDGLTGLPGRIANRINNGIGLLSTGMKLMNRGGGFTARDMGNITEMGKAAEVVPKGVEKGLIDIGNMLGKDKALKRAINWINGKTDEVGDAVNRMNEEQENEGVLKATAGFVANMPGELLDMTIGAAFGTVTGIDLSGREVRAVDVDEHAKMFKTTLGNIAGLGVEAAVGKMMVKASLAPVKGLMGGAAKMDDVATGALGQIAAIEPKMGKLGMAIKQDVTSIAAGGVTQGLVAEANTEETLKAGLMGLMFAPIGVVTGWYRGVKGSNKLMDSIQEAGDIKRWRDFQEVKEGGIAVTDDKVTKLFNADDIVDVMSEDLFTSDVPVIIRGVSEMQYNTLVMRMNQFSYGGTGGQGNWHKTAGLLPKENLVKGGQPWEVESYDILTGGMGVLSAKDIDHFRATGNLPTKLKFTDEEYVTPEGEALVNLADKNLTKSQEQANWDTLYPNASGTLQLAGSSPGVQTGTPVSFFGFRVTRGAEIPGTGRFYAASRIHAEQYKKPGSLFMVHKLEFENPLVIEGKHRAMVEEIRDKLYLHEKGKVVDLPVVPAYEGSQKNRVILDNLLIEEKGNAYDAYEAQDAWENGGQYVKPPEPVYESLKELKQVIVNNIDDVNEAKELLAEAEYYFEHHRSYRNKYVRPADDPDALIEAHGVFFTPAEAKAFNAAAEITYSSQWTKKAAGLHPEAGYQLMDKILARVAKGQGHDSIIYKTDLEGTEIVDLTGKARMSRTTEKVASQTLRFKGEDYEVSDLGFTTDKNTLSVIHKDTGTRVLLDKNAVQFITPEYRMIDDTNAMDELYKEFKKTLTPDTNFTAAITKFVADRKIESQTTQFLHEFGKREIDDIVDPWEKTRLREVLSANIETRAKSFLEGREAEMAEAAARGGFYFTNEHGLLKIRDNATGEVLAHASTTKEAIQLMERMGVPPNVPEPTLAATAGSPPPPNIPHTGGTTHAGDNYEPRNDPWSPNRDAMNPKTALFNLRVANFTSMKGFMDLVDTLRFDDKVNLNTGFRKLEKAIVDTEVEIRNTMESAELKLIDAFVRSGKRKVGFEGRFNEEMLQKVGMWIEAQNVDEIMAPGGFAKGKTVSPKAKELAEFMFENGVDHTKALQYRRSLSALDAKFVKVNKNKARENYELNTTSGTMDDAMANEIYQKEVAAGPQTNEIYVHQRTILDEKFGAARPEFLEAIKRYEALAQTLDGSFNMAAASRIKVAMDNPTTHNLTRAEYAAQHGLNADQLKLGEMIEAQYQKLGSRFKIDDSRMFMRYMNHYRQFGDIVDNFSMTDFERGITDQSVREFASAMIRSGEIANYSMNPVENLQAYIRAGVKKETLYTELTDAFDATNGYMNKEVDKITDIEIRELVKTRLGSYLRDITGQVSMSEKQFLHAKAGMLSDWMGKNTNEILHEMQRPDRVDTVMSMVNASLLGGRVSLAFRDNVDVWQKYFIKHGPTRLWNMLTMKVDKATIEQLVQSGTIIRPDAIDMLNPGAYRDGKRGAFSNAMKELADFGFKTSLQGHYYLKNQAAVYLETKSFVGKQVWDFSQKKKSFDELADEIFLNSYDPATQREFRAFVMDGKAESAANLLASEEIRSTVGRMTRGNQPPIANTVPGKMFGQMGSWSMANRTVAQDMVTRGSRKEIKRSVTRYLIASGGIYGAGIATGLNLGTWIMTPMSFVTTGGPMIQAMENAKNLVTSSLGNNEKQSNFAEREIARSAMMLVPGANLIKDVRSAADMVQNGRGLEVRALARATGIGVNTEDRTFLDMILGTQPYKWQDENPGMLEDISRTIGFP